MVKVKEEAKFRADNPDSHLFFQKGLQYCSPFF